MTGFGLSADSRVLRLNDRCRQYRTLSDPRRGCPLCARTAILGALARGQTFDGAECPQRLLSQVVKGTSRPISVVQTAEFMAEKRTSPEERNYSPRGRNLAGARWHLRLTDTQGRI